MIARIEITKDSIVATNWNRARFIGRLDPDNFIPIEKNPLLSKFFVNIGYADSLGSGVRNLYKYTPIYADGQMPELFEDGIFRTVVPLALVDVLTDKNERQIQAANPSGKVADKVTDKVPEVTDRVTDRVTDKKQAPKTSGKLTDGEQTFYTQLLKYFEANEWASNLDIRNFTGNSEMSVKRYLSKLVAKGCLEAEGKNKTRRYRLAKSPKMDTD
jgi:ATP-dependent DNA helicase RecG